MKPLAEFIFDNILALGPSEDITLQCLNEVNVRLWRTLRCTSFPHQPQKALNGAILGAETVMRVIYKGKLAVGFRWWLRRDRKIIQRGHTDQYGMAVDLDVDLSFEERLFQYKISIFEPAKRRQRRKAVS